MAGKMFCPSVTVFSTCKLVVIPSPNPQEHFGFNYIGEYKLLSNRWNGVMLVPKIGSIPDNFQKTSALQVVPVE